MYSEKTHRAFVSPRDLSGAGNAFVREAMEVRGKDPETCETTLYVENVAYQCYEIDGHLARDLAKAAGKRPDVELVFFKKHRRNDEVSILKVPQLFEDKKLGRDIARALRSLRRRPVAAMTASRVVVSGLD